MTNKVFLFSPFFMARNLLFLAFFCSFKVFFSFLFVICSYVDEISATNNSKVSELDIYQVAQQSASEYVDLKDDKRHCRAHNCAQELNTFIRRYNEVENVDLNHVSVYLWDLRYEVVLRFKDWETRLHCWRIRLHGYNGVNFIDLEFVVRPFIILIVIIISSLCCCALDHKFCLVIFLVLINKWNEFYYVNCDSWTLFLHKTSIALFYRYFQLSKKNNKFKNKEKHKIEFVQFHISFFIRSFSFRFSFLLHSSPWNLNYNANSKDDSRRYNFSLLVNSYHITHLYPRIQVPLAQSGWKLLCVLCWNSTFCCWMEIYIHSSVFLLFIVCSPDSAFELIELYYALINLWITIFLYDSIEANWQNCGMTRRKRLKMDTNTEENDDGTKYDSIIMLI